MYQRCSSFVPECCYGCRICGDELSLKGKASSLANMSLLGGSEWVAQGQPQATVAECVAAIVAAISFF